MSSNLNGPPTEKAGGCCKEKDGKKVCTKETPALTPEPKKEGGCCKEKDGKKVCSKANIELTPEPAQTEGGCCKEIDGKKVCSKTPVAPEEKKDDCCSKKEGKTACSKKDAGLTTALLEPEEKKDGCCSMKDGKKVCSKKADDLNSLESQSPREAGDLCGHKKSWSVYMPDPVVSWAIMLRIFFEISLGTVLKACYSYNESAELLLLISNVVVVLLCYFCYAVESAFTSNPSGLFVKREDRWLNPSLKGIALVVGPSLCLAASNLFKQYVVRDEGPGYMELIGTCCITFSAILQYVVNGIKIKKLSLASTILATMTYLSTFWLCGFRAPFIGGISGLFCVLRCVAQKRINEDLNYSPGYNLMLSSLIALPFYGAATLFRKGDLGLDTIYSLHSVPLIGSVPMLTWPVMIMSVLTFVSQVLTFVLYDLCTPLTIALVSCSGLKGLVSTLVDVWYLDYYTIVFFNRVLGGKLDTIRFKNKNALKPITYGAFTLKTIYFSLFMADKAQNARKNGKCRECEEFDLSRLPADFPRAKEKCKDACC